MDLSYYINYIRKIPECPGTLAFLWKTENSVALHDGYYSEIFLKQYVKGTIKLKSLINKAENDCVDLLILNNK